MNFIDVIALGNGKYLKRYWKDFSGKKEIKYINKIEMLKSKIKEYCKTHKMKFEKYIDNGFVASRLVDIEAGMEKDLHTGKLISIPIRKIGTKRVFRKFICYSDGDIVDNGLV